MPHYLVPPTHRRFGKTMRQNMTEAELALWRRLRKPGIAGMRFRRQAPIGPYIVDFFCPQRRLIIEVDGGHHGSSEDTDRERDTWLTERGYRVVRFWNNDVLTNLRGVIETIASSLNAGIPPHPDSARVASEIRPLPAGGER